VHILGSFGVAKRQSQPLDPPIDPSHVALFLLVPLVPTFLLLYHLSFRTSSIALERLRDLESSLRPILMLRAHALTLAHVTVFRES